MANDLQNAWNDLKEEIPHACDGCTGICGRGEDGPCNAQRWLDEAVAKVEGMLDLWTYCQDAMPTEDGSYEVAVVSSNENAHIRHLSWNAALMEWGHWQPIVDEGKFEKPWVSFGNRYVTPYAWRPAPSRVTTVPELPPADESAA